MKRFTIRVYGIWINEMQEILVCDERIRDFRFTKFPGGGLEFGEGIKDCLIREWQEELNLAIEVEAHFYTTDFFQVSAFDQSTQVISIYYLVKPASTQTDSLNLKPVMQNPGQHEDNEIHFRFIPIADFTPEHVTLPIDKHVVSLLRHKTIT